MIIGTMPKQVEYALMALLDMQRGHPGKLFSVRELCDRHHVPFDVLSKTMQRLVKASILRSVQGVNGGYQIAKDLEAVTLLDLMEAVVGSVAAVNCLKPCGCARSETCTISGSMHRLNDQLCAFYAGVAVMGLIEE